MVALALPLAPLAPGAAAAAGTFVIGSAAYIAQQVHGFRAPLPAPMIPRTGGKAGGATMREMVADAIAGARIPVAFPPNPLGPQGNLGLAGLLAVAGLLGPRLSQLWGRLAGRPQTSRPQSPTEGDQIKGTMPPAGNTQPGTLTLGVSPYSFDTRAGDCSPERWVRSEPGASAFWSTSGVTSFKHVKIPAPNCGGFGGSELEYVRNGQTLKRVLVGLATHGYVFWDGAWQIDWAGPGAVPIPSSDASIPLPPDYKPSPAPEPEPITKPLPLTPRPAVPAPAQQPEPERSPVPVQPGPARPPVTVPAPPSTAPKAPPVPARVIVVRPDGNLPAPAKDPVAVTHPDAHYPIPGGGPIVGNGPQAKPEEIAKELGRLEQKLNGILNPTPDTPIEWRDLLQQVLEAIMNLKDGTTYTITEKCPPCDGSQYDPPTVKAEAPGALNAFGVITNRLDAIAKLLDGQLGLKQQVCPPCKPQLSGEWVSVHFVSDEASPGGEKPLRKKFRYLDQTYAPLADHIAHWENFEWDAGPVIVVSKNLPWGVPKVWAATAAEGKRVIRHAAQIAGVNLQDPRHQWIVTGSGDPRYGQTGHMRVDTRGGQFVRITKRPGPDGLPTGVAPSS